MHFSKLCSESLVLRNHGFQGWRHDLVKICDMWWNPHQRLFHLSLELPFNLLQIGINLGSDFWFRACVRLSGDNYYQYQEGKPRRDASEQHVWSFACVSKKNSTIRIYSRSEDTMTKYSLCRTLKFLIRCKLR